MIKEINLNNIATYTKSTVVKPLDINFCYGNNGSGKTTISKIIGKQEVNPECKLVWENDAELPVLTYNKKFVMDNFTLTDKIGGIFTLGKDSKDAKEIIDKTKEMLENSKELKNGYITEKKKLMVNQEEIENNIDDICWKIEQLQGETFKNALVGYRASKKDFTKKCLEEYSNLDDEIPDKLKIQELYNSAFNSSKIEYDQISEVNIDENLIEEKSKLFLEYISGSAKSPIGMFIEYLQNSAWIKEGQNYIEKAEGKCPYCQQELPIEVQKGIEEFFDMEYERKCAEIKKFNDDYQKMVNENITNLKAIIAKKLPFIKSEIFEIKVREFVNIYEMNKKTILEKLKNPTLTLKLESLKDITNELNTIIDECNKNIQKNNEVVKNQKEEQENCKRLVWKLIVYELRSDLQSFNRVKRGITEGINALDKKIEEQEEKIKQYNEIISEKETSITSVLPTVIEINKILSKFGFSGFKLAENVSEKGTYKIVRENGDDVHDTLSEGEYRFITFLYYYNLVYGSYERFGVNSDKVVVIDDPISSLDSNVVFIISTLVKKILLDCKEKRNGIKQVFVLTHNVYFYKEVTFLGSREKYPTERTLYWVVSKNNNVSEIKVSKYNQIQTSYKLLWQELKKPQEEQSVTIFNTMRRILEYYFNIIGGINYEECVDKFDGEDQMICKSLISCVNDGSHYISDDFVVCFDEGFINKYLNVFRLIFIKMGHENHYNMMMEIQ